MRTLRRPRERAQATFSSRRVPPQHERLAVEVLACRRLAGTPAPLAATGPAQSVPCGGTRPALRELRTFAGHLGLEIRKPSLRDLGPVALKRRALNPMRTDRMPGGPRWLPPSSLQGPRLEAETQALLGLPQRCTCKGAHAVAIFSKTHSLERLIRRL